MSVVRVLKKIPIYMLNLLLYYLAYIIPKKKNLWVFGSWFGERYADNSKYLFEYVNKEHRYINPVWLTRSDEVLRKLRDSNYKCYKLYSMKSIIIGLMAQYSIVVQSNLVDLFPFLNNPFTKNIQLWHGIPLKKIGFDDIFTREIVKKNRIKEKIIPFLREEYNLSISCSEFDKKSFQSAFNTKRIVITGYPRNDALFVNQRKKNHLSITYLPTLRDSVGDEIDLFSDYSFNLNEWDIFLGLSNFKLNIKVHPVNKVNDKFLLQIEKSHNINYLEDIDTADLLIDTDILITDYSSVFFDFLLLDRPVIFAPFDFDKYIIKDRELYYDYDEIIPGPKCMTWLEVKKSIEMLIEDPMKFSEKRNVIKQRFHQYSDNRSCERVFYEIFSINCFKKNLLDK